jgi:pyruvate formate lyase activating enzyme
MTEVLKERIFFEQSGGGVTLTGGEPLFQPEFAMALLSVCRRYGVRTAIDTSGFVDAKVLLDAAPRTDLFLYDVKHMDPEKHRRCTGVDNGVILSNLSKLGEAGAAVNVRMPFIPGINTDDENVEAMGAFLSRVRGIVGINLLPYHTAAEDKHDRWGMGYRLRGVRAPDVDSLRRAARILETWGLRAVIGG